MIAKIDLLKEMIGKREKIIIYLENNLLIINSPNLSYGGVALFKCSEEVYTALKAYQFFKSYEGSAISFHNDEYLTDKIIFSVHAGEYGDFSHTVDKDLYEKMLLRFRNYLDGTGDFESYSSVLDKF